MNKNEDFDYNEMKMAEAASGTFDYVEKYYIVAKKDSVFNLHFRYWAEAFNKFQSLNENNFCLEEGLIIINCLCNSLAILAGMNMKARNNVPGLVELYEKTLKKDKKWIIDSELLKDLKEMNNYYNNLSKHLNQVDWRKAMLKEITYKKICKYMNTAKEIWLWILNKKYNDNIPEDKLCFFDHNFLDS